MTAKEALDKMNKLLKQHFSGGAPAEDPKQKFESGKLKDGTAVEYSALEVGGNLFVLDADGAQQPAAVGEYELEDGTVLVVTEPGIIAEVKEAPEAPAEEQQMAAGDPATPSGVDWKPSIDELKSSLAWMAQRITTLEASIQTFKSASAETFKSMVALMEAVSNDSKEPAITKPKQTVFSSEKDKKQSAFDKAIAGIQAYNERLSKK